MLSSTPIFLAFAFAFAVYGVSLQVDAFSVASVSRTETIISSALFAAHRTTTTTGNECEGVYENRREAVGRVVCTFAAAAAGIATVATANQMIAEPALASEEKQLNLSDEEILKIVVDKDLVVSQFLVTGQLTRSIYDEGASFRDEIDTYTLDKWIKGTSALFDGNRSRVLLVPGSVKANGTTLQFRFVEYLCFQVPIAKPIVYLSGTLFLERSPDTGLITSYREQWDQDVNTVLTKNSKLFTSGISNESLDKELDAFFDKNAK